MSVPLKELPIASISSTFHRAPIIMMVVLGYENGYGVPQVNKWSPSTLRDNWGMSNSQPLTFA